MFQACGSLLAAYRLADGRRDGGSVWLAGQIYAGVTGMDSCPHRTPACHRLPARRRTGGLFRRLWWRHHPRTDSCHHEGFPHRKLRCHRIDMLFPAVAPTSSPALGLLCILVLSGDCWSKFCASQIVNYLPYARKEEDSKSKTVYNRMSRHELLAGFLCGLFPFVLLLPIKLWIATLFPLLTFFLLYRLMKRRLQGYTGDCCGATFLLCELSFYLGSLILIIN